MDNLVYHYCSNKKAFSILQSRTIRLSDVTKSNDIREMTLFYPGIFETINNAYVIKHFDFNYKDKKDLSGLMLLNEDAKLQINKELSDGVFSNFVFCFSEKQDMLSQWRAYADDGRGACLGFKKQSMIDFCNNKKTFAFEKVIYIDERGLGRVLEFFALELLDKLNALQTNIDSTYGDRQESTDILLLYNYIGQIKQVLTASLIYKLADFEEENEWRFFLLNLHYKHSDWLLLSKLKSGSAFSDITQLLNGKLDFNITSNDIIPFFGIPIDDIDENIIKSITLGPNNQVKDADIRLFLCKYKYKDDILLSKSNISYKIK